MTQHLTIPTPVDQDFAWSLERYHQAIERGVLTEDDQVELIAGRIIAKMPIGKMHAACVGLLNEYFFDRLGRTYQYRLENPVTLVDNSEPEPDFVVVTRKEGFYKTAHPGPADIHLIIEVADNTLERDRQLKAPLYAAAGLPEYWIINLKNRQVEVYLQPDPAEATYGSVTHYREEAVFQSLLVGEVKVSDLLP